MQKFIYLFFFLLKPLAESQKKFLRKDSVMSISIFKLLKKDIFVKMSSKQLKQAKSFFYARVTAFELRDISDTYILLKDI